jgi:hypothetical protein
MNRNIEIIYNPPILNPNSIYNNFCNKPYKQTYVIPIKYNQVFNKSYESYDPLLDPVLNKKLNPLLNPRFNSNNKKPLVLNIPKYKQINPISFIFKKIIGK